MPSLCLGMHNAYQHLPIPRIFLSAAEKHTQASSSTSSTCTIVLQSMCWSPLQGYAPQKAAQIHLLSFSVPRTAVRGSRYIITHSWGTLMRITWDAQCNFRSFFLSLVCAQIWINPCMDHGLEMWWPSFRQEVCPHCTLFLSEAGSL